MTIAVIGAGAMGCLYGGYLSAENKVIMIDSYRPQAEAIAEKGIRIVETDGSEKTYKENISACLSGECREKADLVIVFVKSTNTDSALAENRALFGEDTLVLTLQNGAGNDRKVAKYVRPENVLIGTSKHNAVNLGGGRTRHGGFGVTIVGSTSGRADAAEKIAAA
ncbi:MAG TPA: NAD-binding protein, partial [Candidatus Scatosoma pullicola]|nr:NAD-binding protein [Candidatus Scatosoma pullicola]